MARDQDLFRWQFDLTWSLLEYHLDRLDDDDCLWPPADRCWTVRPAGDGRWVPDWEEPEPDPPPATSIGWLTWHLGWWWTSAVAAVTGAPIPPRTDVYWPGDAERTVAWLRGLRDEWVAAVAGLTKSDLAAQASFPWADRSDRSVGHTVGWVNAELMKNTAEIGQTRLLRAARLR